jgi:hypothetical protein
LFHGGLAVRITLQNSITFSLITLIAALSGCKTAPPSRQNIDTSNLYIDDVGSVRVAVVSVAPWSTYAQALQPKFNITSEDAFNKAIANTKIESLSTLSKTLAKVRAGLEQSTTTTTTTTTSDSDDNTSRSTTSTDETKPGTLPAAVTNTGNAPAQKLGASPSTNIDVEPRLHYRAATALYQEVQLLDRYIDDAVRREGYAPYLVRIQINLMPVRRNLPLDAYVNMTFFSGNPKDESDTDTVAVVPLISTDSHESALSSTIAKNITDIGLSISALSNNAAAIELGKLYERLSDDLGRNLNNTFTVGRLSENSVRIRIGALWQQSTQYSMVPRTESVTLLVLVPKQRAKHSNANKRNIHVNIYSDMINTVTGKRIEEKPDRRESDDVEALISRFLVDGTDTKCLAKKKIAEAKLFVDLLWDKTLDNDWHSYNEELSRNICKAPNSETDTGSLYCKSLCAGSQYEYATQLWNEIVKLNTGYQVDITNFEVPMVRQGRLFPAQSVTIKEQNGKAIATLYDGSYMNNRDLCSAIYTLSKNGRKVINIFPGRLTQIEQGGKMARFEYDALSENGSWTADNDNRLLQVRAAYVDNSNGSTECWAKLNGSKNDRFTSKSVLYIDSKKPEQ